MPDLVTLIKGAREHMEEGRAHHAHLFYNQVLKGTEKIVVATDRLARGEACAYFAKVALAQNKIGEAGDWYRRAIDADPAFGDYRAELVMQVLIPLGMMRAARDEATRATQLDPESAKAWRALGKVEHEEGNADASRRAKEAALSLRPDDPFLMLELGHLELDASNYGRAWELAAGVLREHPERKGDALVLQGALSYRQGYHMDAIRYYTQALDAGCSDPPAARFNRALPEHALDDYERGWADYEARGELSNVHSIPFKRFVPPIWKGEPPPTRLHLHEEMGYGDTIALARYVPVLHAQGYEVRLEVRPELVGLFERSFPMLGVKVMPRAIDYPGAFAIPEFDYHVPMLSLPHIMGTAIDTAPWTGPYLHATREKAYDLPSGMKIGIAWSSGIREGMWLREYGRLKSMRFSQMQPILDARDATWVSLQIGPEASECARDSRVLTPLADNVTWDNTAALIADLDLVITVDTAVAHLAGAMGKPVWVMHARHAASWHWGIGKGDPVERSAWYPSARIYRQGKSEDWSDVIARVGEDLRS